MDRKMRAFLQSVVSKGKITQKETDSKMAKQDKKEAAKKNYKVNGKSMKKDELVALLEELAN